MTALDARALQNHIPVPLIARDLVIVTESRHFTQNTFARIRSRASFGIVPHTRTVDGNRSRVVDLGSRLMAVMTQDAEARFEPEPWRKWLSFAQAKTIKLCEVQRVWHNAPENRPIC